MLKLKIATPKGSKVNVDATFVSVPGANGEIGVLPGHTALLSLLNCGVLAWDGPTPGTLAVNRGFVEVLDDRVTVLTETAEAADEIDIERARKALKRAQDRLLSSDPSGNTDVARAEYAIHRALARLRLKEGQH